MATHQDINTTQQDAEDVGLGDMVLTFARQLIGFICCSWLAWAIASSMLAYALLYIAFCLIFFVLDAKYGAQLQAKLISETATRKVGRFTRFTLTPSEWRTVYAKKAEHMAKAANGDTIDVEATVVA